MSSERGSTTIWLLGLALLLLLFGGLGLDFWRGLAMQRELAAVADSAAVAGASGIDEEHYRATGEVVLEPGRAVSLAQTSLAFQDVDLIASEIVVAADGLSIEVMVETLVDPLLIGVFIDDDSPLTVRGSAIAEPRLIP